MKKIKNANRIVTAILAIVLILGLAVPASAAAHAFTDTPDWCADAADWAASQGIAAGVGNGKFAPGDPCTVAQIVTMLWRAAGEPSSKSTFPGKAPDYAKAAMNWAYGKSIISKDANSDATCKRAAAALLIYRAFGSPSSSANTGFADVESTASYAKAVKWAVDNGIVAGVGGNKFDPMGSCTRGQIVTLLHRAYVESARLNAGSSTPSTQAPATTDTSAAEKTLKNYGTIQTLVKSVGNPTAANSSNKKTTSYGTVGWSNAAQGYFTFTASKQGLTLIIDAPSGMSSYFEVSKDTTAKIAFAEGTGKYTYAICHVSADGKYYDVDYKDSIAVSRIDADLAPFLVSTHYGDYANAPTATAKAKSLYSSGKTQLQNVQAMASYVGGLKYDSKLKQGYVDTYVNPDSVISNGGGVCNEMSKLLVAMLRSQGIPAYHVGGYHPNGESHAWVMAWVEISSYVQNGTTYSKGAWVLVESTSGTIKTTSEASKYKTVDSIN